MSAVRTFCTDHRATYRTLFHNYDTSKVYSVSSPVLHAQPGVDRILRATDLGIRSVLVSLITNSHCLGANAYQVRPFSYSTESRAYASSLLKL
jgi:hypothetical protein